MKIENEEVATAIYGYAPTLHDAWLQGLELTGRTCILKLVYCDTPEGRPILGSNDIYALLVIEILGVIEVSWPLSADSIYHHEVDLVNGQLVLKLEMNDGRSGHIVGSSIRYLSCEVVTRDQARDLKRNELLTLTPSANHL